MLFARMLSKENQNLLCKKIKSEEERIHFGLILDYSFTAEGEDAGDHVRLFE